jgi:acyl-homoserine lactone acylase PvdQ
MKNLLSAEDSLDAEDFARFQADVLVPGALEERDRRLDRLSIARSGMARQGAEALRRWSGRADLDSVAPTFYRAWEAFGPAGEDLERACAYLSRRLGPDSQTWTWGRVHQVLLRHPLSDLDSTLSIGPFPRAGDRGTLNVAGYARFDTTSWPPAISLHGPAVRNIVDLSPDGRMWSVLLAGQSGDPESPHYDDQIDLWSDVKYWTWPRLGERPEFIESSEWLMPDGASAPLPH